MRLQFLNLPKKQSNWTEQKMRLWVIWNSVRSSCEPSPLSPDSFDAAALLGKISLFAVISFFCSELIFAWGWERVKDIWTFNKVYKKTSEDSICHFIWIVKFNWMKLYLKFNVYNQSISSIQLHHITTVCRSHTISKRRLIKEYLSNISSRSRPEW